MIYRFLDFELDTTREMLCRGDVEIALEPRAYALLCHLVENRDRMVSKDELIEQVWDGQIVSDDAIFTAVKAARRAVGDDGVQQSVVKTLRARGFRFVAPVRPLAPARGADPVGEDAAAEEKTDGRPSIAILPFQLLGTSDTCAAIADALPAELITSLSRIRWLRVFARGSCFRFRGGSADLEAVRSAFGAGYALSGIVEIFGRELTISIELTDTRNMSVVWSDRFRGAIEDVHDIRSNIAAHVVSELELHIPLNEADAARLRAPHNLDAWGHFHLGLQHMFRFNRADNGTAAQYLERATALDPAFPRAFAARSFTSFQNAFLNYTPDRQAEILNARRLAERSVELDPFDPLGNFTLARAHWLEGNPEGGMGWIARAIEFSPNFAHGHYAHGWMDAMAGRSGDALRHIETAIDLSPLDPFLYAMQATRAMAHLLEGDTSAAAHWAERAARAPLAHYLISMIAVAAHQMNGDTRKASEWADHARTRNPEVSVEQFFEAFPFNDPAVRSEISQALVNAENGR